MNDHFLLRYSRQIMLDDIGIDGQEKIQQAKVLIIGLGGLGSPAALYLSASGVGQLTFVDPDHVELSNLQRQIIHQTADIGTDKVTSAKQSCLAINPENKIITINRALDEAELAKQVSLHDIVLDCSDNFTTRFLVNKACYQYKKILISGAVIRLEGQISSFNFQQSEEACYRCLYTEDGELDTNCSRNGILSPVAGIIGSMQATEAIKAMVNLPLLSNQLQLLDAKHMEWRTIKLRKDPDGPVCGR